MNKSLVRKMNSSRLDRCKICDRQGILETHHISGRDIEGWDSSWNRCNLCSNCHTDVGAGLIQIDGWRMTSDGLQLQWTDYR